MSWGCPGDQLHPTNSFSWKTPYFEKLADFSCFMWICGGFVPCGPSALLASKKDSLGKKTCHLAVPLIMERKIRNFKKYRFYFSSFYWSKVVFWVKKNGVLLVFWTGCEVADMKQRQKATAVDNRNKIQSLVLPTDDP